MVDANNKITSTQAMEYVEEIPCYVRMCGDFEGGVLRAKTPQYPAGRDDICVVNYAGETVKFGPKDFGHDIFYVLWRNADGAIQHQKIFDSENIRGYYFADEVVIDDKHLVIALRGSGKNFSGDSLPAFKKSVSLNQLEGFTLS